MNGSILVDNAYSEVVGKNPKYSLGNILKTACKIGFVTAFVFKSFLPSGTVNAQTKKIYPRTLSRPPVSRTVRQPVGATIYRQPLSRTPVSANPRPSRTISGAAALRTPRTSTARMPTISRQYSTRMPVSAIYYSRGFYGYGYGGLFYPFGIGPYAHISFINYFNRNMRARMMFCGYPTWGGVWGVPVQEVRESEEVIEYQKRIEELESRIDELEKRKPQVIEKEKIIREVEVKEVPVEKVVEVEKKVPVYIEKEVPVEVEKKGHQFGYQDGGMYPDQIPFEIFGYVNDVLEEMDLDKELHIYSNSVLTVDSKKYRFKLILRKNNATRDPLLVFEVPYEGTAEEKEKLELINSGKLGIPAYVISPTKIGPELKEQIDPYIKAALKSYSDF